MIRPKEFGRLGPLAIAAAIGVTISLSGCGMNGAQSAGQIASAADVRSIAAAERPEIDGESSWQGSLAAAGMDMTAVARDQRAWLILWQLIGEEPPASLPDDTMAAAVFLGARPTDGYSVSVDEVLSSRVGTIVRYSEDQPGSGADVAQAVIAPYTVVLLPASAEVVHFERLR
jgi:hypothetical protein